MAWNFIGSAEGAATANPTTGSLDTTLAKLIVMHCCGFNSYTPDDSVGSQPWVELPERLQSPLKSKISYLINPITSPTHTFTASGAAVIGSVIVQAFSAGGVITFDQEISAGTASGTFLNTGSLTPSKNGSLLVCGHGIGAVQANSIDSGFDETNEVPFSGGNWEGSSLAWLEQAIAAAINPRWTGTGSTGRTANLAVFLEAAIGKGVAFDAAKDTALDTARDTAS